MYGDTDSIFVNSGSTDYREAAKIAAETQKELNKMWRLLEVCTRIIPSHVSRVNVCMCACAGASLSLFSCCQKHCIEWLGCCADSFHSGFLSGRASLWSLLLLGWSGWRLLPASASQQEEVRMHLCV